MAQTHDSSHGPPELQTVTSERTPLISRTTDSPIFSDDNQNHQDDHDATRDPSNSSPKDEFSLLAIVGSMCCLWLSVFLAALDSTVVATLSSSITSSFESGASFTWIASGYLISNAACQPLSGKLTDIYGRRAGLIFASTFFGIGTLICGIAPNAPVLILGRVVAGIGGGCINAISVFIGSDLVPLRKRGVLTGLGNVVWGTGTGLGGLYGGLINDHLNWRYAFLLQLPFIVVGAVLGVWMVKLPPTKEEDTESKLRRVDILGALTLTISLILVLLGLSSGGNIVPFSHPLVYVSLALGILFLAVFVYVEEKVSIEPIIPISKLLLNRTVLAACLGLWFNTMGMFMLMYYIPVYYQVVRGVSATRAGAPFIAQSVGTALGSLGAGFYIRSTGRYRLMGIVAQLIAVAAAALMFAFLRNASPALPFVFFGMAGFSYGAVLTVALLAMISAVDHQWQAVVTATSYAFRSTGSTIGIAAGTAIFQNLLRQKLSVQFGQLPDGPERIRKLMASFEYFHKLPESWRVDAVQCYVEALDGVWLGTLVFAVITFVAMMFLRQNRLFNNLDRTS